MELTTKKVLMVIAPENFRDEEYFHTRESIEKAGLDVTVASTAKQAISSIDKETVDVDILLDEATKDYEAIVFVGGGGAKIYLHDEKVLKLAREFYDDGKIVAAICIAPAILVNAEILKDKTATSWEGVREDIEAAGNTYTGDSVTIDGNIITGNGPHSGYEFGEAIANAISNI
jgi:protease I